MTLQRIKPEGPIKPALITYLAMEKLAAYIRATKNNAKCASKEFFKTLQK